MVSGSKVLECPTDLGMFYVDHWSRLYLVVSFLSCLVGGLVDKRLSILSVCPQPHQLAYCCWNEVN